MTTTADPVVAVPWAQQVLTEVGRAVVGHDSTVQRMLIALATGGHVLVEGLPGLAKTLVAQAVARASGLTCHRIQFTPDLLPADVTGTMVYDPKEIAFVAHRGPVFANVIVADEINRAPAKVQSALLEAMQERQVTLGKDTLPLPSPFLVLATQNPLDHEGTFPLPDAQLDRFLFKLKARYPASEEERRILRLDLAPAAAVVSPVISSETVLASHESLAAVYVDDAIVDYVQRLAAASRNPGEKGIRALQPLIRTGISPRAAAAWIRAARAGAYFAGRAFVLPADVADLAHDVLRHRIVLSLDAEADGVAPDEVIDHLVRAVTSP